MSGTKRGYLGVIGIMAVVPLLLPPWSRAESPEAHAPKTAKTKALEAGAALLQRKVPPSRLGIYLDGFHFRSGDMGHQMEAHHYCAELDEDFTQCALFDGDGDKARLVGVEYIVSAKLFRALPDSERRLWHSHEYEVKSGELVAPGLPDAAEKEFLKKVATTYGKTWHTWDTRHGDTSVPRGIPALMMGFTADGQLDTSLVARRDRALKVSTAAKRRERADIPAPPPLPGANPWEKGPSPQLSLRETGGAKAARGLAPDSLPDRPGPAK